MDTRYLKAAEEVDKANGDAAEAAYWHMKMLTDPTQEKSRRSHGYSGLVLSERDAFKKAFRLFKGL